MSSWVDFVPAEQVGPQTFWQWRSVFSQDVIAILDWERTRPSFGGVTVN